MTHCMKKTLIAFLLMTFALTEVSAKMNQTGYRWRNDDGNETAATWKAPEGQYINLNGIETIRLRIQANNLFSENDSFNEDISLYYSSGTFGSPWQKITTNPGNAFVLFNSPHLSDLTPTSRQLNAQAETFQPGVFFESTSDHGVTMPYGFYSEYEWAIRPSESAGPDIYYFALGHGEEDAPIITVAQEEDAARLNFDPNPASVPLKKWSVYASLLMLTGFILIRYRKLL